MKAQMKGAEFTYHSADEFDYGISGSALGFLHRFPFGGKLTLVADSGEKLTVDVTEEDSRDKALEFNAVHLKAEGNWMIAEMGDKSFEFQSYNEFLFKVNEFIKAFPTGGNLTLTSDSGEKKVIDVGAGKSPAQRTKEFLKKHKVPLGIFENDVL